MVVALFALAALFVVSASAMLVGSSGLRATRNYRGASQVHLVAESAIQHAMQVVNGPGVIRFDTNVVDPWNTIFGTAARSFGPVAGYSYTVAAFADDTDSTNRGRFVATATGPEGVRNTVVAAVNRSDIPNTAPGAIYLSQNAQTNSTFNGNGFRVDGNDRNYTGGAGPNPPIPGISTRTDANTQETIDSLNDNQKHDVTGLGYSAGPPVVPSVFTSPAAPSVAQVNQFVDDLLGLDHNTVQANQVNNSTQGLDGWCKRSGDDPPCTPQPKITYFTPSSGNQVTIKGNGNIEGAGIMIVDGDLKIQGTLDFKGLIIVRGRTIVEYDPDSETEVTGNAALWGSLWTNDVNLVIGGSAFVQYSAEALTLASQVAENSPLPAPVQVSALIDCAQVPSGTNDCP